MTVTFDKLLGQPLAHSHVVSDVKSTGAESGQVVTADGVGGSSWATPANPEWLAAQIASALEFTNIFTMPIAHFNLVTQYLPYGHHYNYGRQELSAYGPSNEPLQILEVPRKLLQPTGVYDPFGFEVKAGETPNASVVDWCNRCVRQESFFGDPFPEVSHLVWIEQTFLLVPPSPWLMGNASDFRGYLGPDVDIFQSEYHAWSSELAWNTIFLPSLPEGYQWEVWRRRRKHVESTSYAGGHPLRQSYGNYVLYDRLAAGVTTYSPDAQTCKREPAFRFGLLNTTTYSRSLLSREVCFDRNGAALGFR